MTAEEARAYYNYLMTLCIRREESFGPLALTFLRDPRFDHYPLTPEERFNLYMATSEVFAPEPKRYTARLECLNKAHDLLSQTTFFDPAFARQLQYDIRKTSADLEIYNQAMKVPRPQGLTVQRLTVETEAPEYFLDLAQQRAAAYYQKKYRMPTESKTAQHFGGTPKKFEPENPTIHKEFPGACAPFMAARTNAFHFLLPFDLKISRTPEEPLEAGIRIFYAKIGYSYPLRYEMGRLCGYQDGQMLDIALDDPNLFFVSVSPLRESSFRFIPPDTAPDVPAELAYPLSVLNTVGSLGPFIQVSCKFKVWFDASAVSLLIQGAPDLAEYGLQGASGLMTRSYASDRVEAYAESSRHPWQEGLSYNFVNLHLGLLPGIQSAVIPFNTPIFSLYPVLSRHAYSLEPKPE
ncbi:hypothetical protein W02_09890 [Nitrospira sp. KM1]|uniref:hypothetical protein n=1 Tax=Nitrospira sp. KM1 TaxID=1936990 RepID=UPI0013A75CE5|nr:hypothetical protein [Nitrospira sp. KM1]BCA53849.1 hypothetical protein W02_09890 [Nitrospira sp. KM1]